MLDMKAKRKAALMLKMTDGYIFIRFVQRNEKLLLLPGNEVWTIRKYCCWQRQQHNQFADLK